MSYYTYIYLDPTQPGHFTYSGVSFLFEPFYVGKGSGYRKFIHLTRDIKYESNKLKARKIAKLQNDFNLREYIVTIPAEDEESAFSMERMLVAEIGRRDLRTGPLCNLMDGGGEACVVGPLTREKQSKAKLGKTYEERFGGVRACEIKLSKSIKSTGANNHYFGKKHTPDMIARIVANREYASGTEHHMYGKTHTDEVKKKLSESHKKLVGVKAVRAKFYRFISPTGLTYYVAGGFSTQCAKLGLKSPSYVRKVANGLLESYMGWKCEYITRDEYLESTKIS